MKVLIADKLSKSTEEALQELGATVDVQPDLTLDTLPGAIGDAHVLVVRSTKVTAKTIDAGSQLSLIVRAGAGVNTIDVEAACCTFQLDAPPSESVMASLKENDAILQVSLESR